MKHTGAVVAFAVAVGVFGTPAVSRAAANKEHQQIMAELRMLQEQQSQLQQMIHGLGETLKVITTKIESQGAVAQKAFADQKLLIDNLIETTRILREKADDTNVRLSSVTQELQALRQTISTMPAPSAAFTPATGDPAAGDPAAATQPSGSVPPPNVSPTQWFERVFGDYAAGQYDLAIAGFESFIRSYPNSPQADDAQLYIGNALFNEGKFQEAVQAYQKVISDYPKGDTVPTAYYKLGQTYENLQQIDLARKAYETVVKNYGADPTLIQIATQAQNRLDALNRKR
jgi:tol-pal system protein YbgF